MKKIVISFFYALNVVGNDGFNGLLFSSAASSIVLS